MIESLRPQTCSIQALQFESTNGSLKSGFYIHEATESRGSMVRQQSKMQRFTLQLPSSYFFSAFHKLRSVLRGLFQSLSFPTNNIFCNNNASSFNILTELTAWLICLCHTCKKLCPVVSRGGLFLSQKKKRKKILSVA